MPERILSMRTVEAFRDCMLDASDRHGFPLREHLRDARLPSWDAIDLSDLRTARLQIDGMFKIINWTDPNQIRPLLPLFEDAYAETPIGPDSLHHEIDVYLAADGFRIKHGRMQQLVI